MDRVTKMLLALIAVALWGLLLRPQMTPRRAEAAPPQSTMGAGVPAIAIPTSYGDLALIVQNGRVYRVRFAGTLKVQDSIPLR